MRFPSFLCGAVGTAAAVRISLSPDRQSVACVQPLALMKDKAAVKRLSGNKDRAVRCPFCFGSKGLIVNHLLLEYQSWLLLTYSSTLDRLVQKYSCCWFLSPPWDLLKEFAGFSAPFMPCGNKKKTWHTCPIKKGNFFDFIEDTKVSILHRSFCWVHLQLQWRGDVNSVVLPVSAKR